MKLLNLNEIQKAERQIQIGDKQYDVASQSVGQMISLHNLLSVLEGGADEITQVKGMLEAVRQVIPDCEDKVLESLDFPSITAILEFANATDKEAIENSELEEKEQMEQEGKK